MPEISENVVRLKATLTRANLQKYSFRRRGWHACRRGLATNLYRVGISEKTIQAIPRHANVRTTQTCYIKTATDDAKAAMTKLECCWSVSGQ